ncbi:Macrolide export ATP-binding/permease protein MacB [compost metagenome]
MEELSDIHKRGNTIIMVTHNPDLTTYASRVITMLDGKIHTDSKTPREEPATTDSKRRLDERTSSKSSKKVSSKKKKAKK